MKIFLHQKLFYQKIPYVLVNKSTHHFKYKTLSEILKDWMHRDIIHLNKRRLIPITCTPYIDLGYLQNISLNCVGISERVYFQIMSKSSVIKRDAKSYIIQQLLKNQLYLAKSIKYMNIHSIFGQAHLLRSMCENYVNIAWLIDSCNNKRFDGYIANSLTTAKYLYNKGNCRIQSNHVYLCHEMVHKLRLMFKHTNWSKKQLKNYLNIKYFYQIRKNYDIPSFRCKLLNTSKDSKPVLITYHILCNILHTSFTSYGYKYFSKYYMFSCSFQILNLVTYFLYKSFNCVFMKNIFINKLYPHNLIIINSVLSLLRKDLVVMIYMLIDSRRFKV